MSFNKNDSDPNMALMDCFKEHCITAEVIDCDHYRIRGGLVVETDYILHVQPVIDQCPSQTILFEPFFLSKNYTEFRTLASELLKTSQKILRQQTQPHNDIIQLCRFCETAHNLIDSERTKYIGKVNFMFVKVMAKQRKQLINDLLAATCQFMPKDNDETKKWSKDDRAFVHTVSSLVEAFFLTDHIDGEEYRLSHADKTDHHHALSSDSESTKSKRNLVGHIATPFKVVANTGKGGLHLITGAAGKAAGNLSKHMGAKPTEEGTTATKLSRSSIIVPLSTRSRLSGEKRHFEEQELTKIANEDAKLSVEDDGKPSNPGVVPSYSNPQPTVAFNSSNASATSNDSTSFMLKAKHYFQSNPLVLVGVLIGFIALIKVAGMKQFVIDGDLLALVVFATFCIGLHTPRPIIGGYDVPSSIKSKIVVKKNDVIDRSGRMLLRRSIVTMQMPGDLSAQDLTSANPLKMEDDAATHHDEGHHAVMGSPMAKFPVGAKIGSHNNCWSDPDPSDFVVRGPNYFGDKKKVPSGDYVFPCRGIDLFLTDSCPANVASNPDVFGGRLRELPSFIINFRLPWGVLVFYFEIPKRFVPYVRCAEEKDFCNDAEKQKLIDGMNTLSAPDRTVARFLMADAAQRNKTIKIVPVVVVSYIFEYIELFFGDMLTFYLFCFVNDKYRMDHGSSNRLSVASQLY